MSWKLDRVDDSREAVRRAMDMAYGSYVEQEGKKADQWRDQSIGQLVAHLRHEVDELVANVRRGELGYLLHNAMDAIELAALVLIKAQEALEKEAQHGLGG